MIITLASANLFQVFHWELVRFDLRPFFYEISNFKADPLGRYNKAA